MKDLSDTFDLFENAPKSEQLLKKKEHLAESHGKSPQAYRTISEAADELGVATHVLRFWETKFPEIEPLKKGAGRRYYRPEDISFLKKIRDLLHHEGYTIRGVQALFKKHGKNGFLNSNTAGQQDEEEAGHAKPTSAINLALTQQVVNELRELQALLNAPL